MIQKEEFQSSQDILDEIMKLQAKIPLVQEQERVLRLKSLDFSDHPMIEPFTADMSHEQQEILSEMLIYFNNPFTTPFESDSLSKICKTVYLICCFRKVFHEKFIAILGVNCDGPGRRLPHSLVSELTLTLVYEQRGPHHVSQIFRFPFDKSGFKELMECMNHQMELQEMNLNIQAELPRFIWSIPEKKPSESWKIIPIADEVCGKKPEITSG
jgi:hypothetical protein